MRTEQPLFGIGLHSKSPNVTANSLKNAYYEFSQVKDRTSVAIYGTPGLTKFLTQGDTPWRGLYTFTKGQVMYGVHRGTCYEISSNGISSAIGTINTLIGRVDICDDGDYIVFVDGDDIYTYQTSTSTFAVVADTDKPSNPNTCTFQGLRLLTDENATGQFKGGDPLDPTSWNALNFATAESQPDDMIRIINYLGTLVLFGAYTTEFWDNVGGSGFPYARSIGSDLEYGLAARWSVAKFSGSYAFLCQNREGEVAVMALEGYGIRKLSNPDFEFIINNYANPLGATGFGYMLGGHPMYQLNFPNEGVSWLYDDMTGYWTELTFNGTGRHRAELGVDFLNTTIVSDYESGTLYKLEADTLTDDGFAIHMVLRGRHIYMDKAMFGIDRIELGFGSGAGTVNGQGENPVAGLRLSKDGGHSWGTQIFSRLGKIGEYTYRCIWRRLGRGRDIVPEITITDPIKRVITEATLYLREGV